MLSHQNNYLVLKGPKPCNAEEWTPGNMKRHKLTIIYKYCSDGYLKFQKCQIAAIVFYVQDLWCNVSSINEFKY